MASTTTIQQLPYPDPGDTVDPPRDIKALADKLDPLGFAPVGAMMMWPGAAAPSGWLLMQGQTNLPVSTYPVLAGLLGQVGGMLKMPDMRDAFPMGASATNALGAIGGASAVALTTAQMPAHSHTGKTGIADRSLAHSHIVQTAGTPVGAGGGPAFTGIARNSGTVWGETQDGNTPDHLHLISPEGGGATHENRPPFVAVNFMIKAG